MSKGGHMDMKVRTVRYMFKQGLIGLWRNRAMSIASIGTVAATLVVLGLVIILVLNINNMASLAQAQFDEIQVYLEDDLSIEEINKIGKQIETVQGVSEVIYEQVKPWKNSRKVGVKKHTY